MNTNLKNSSLNRHHVDAGNCEPHIQQRRPTLVPNCPKLGSGPLAGATLFCWGPEHLVHHTSSYHHTPASSPAGPHPAGLQCQGQIYTFDNSLDHTVFLFSNVNCSVCVFVNFIFLNKKSEWSASRLIVFICLAIILMNIIEYSTLSQISIVQ